METLLLFAMPVVQARAAELSLLRLVNKAWLVSILLAPSYPRGDWPRHIAKKGKGSSCGASSCWQTGGRKGEVLSLEKRCEDD